ncbi:unnamed protein product [Medioppia subpectinata]|uniref:Uncharacterized protein n=1 Tax=Medioppia subpectinata TaxID=1979941 RepID=A0A7R9QAV6_9ACAR|nr:unnamed protein product [Medioppia subpectinata]CAG2116984.1 unnamed protein product [Medioppia subpectinata]
MCSRHRHSHCNCSECQPRPIIIYGCPTPEDSQLWGHIPFPPQQFDQKLATESGEPVKRGWFSNWGWGCKRQHHHGCRCAYCDYRYNRHHHNDGGKHCWQRYWAEKGSSPTPSADNPTKIDTNTADAPKS